MGWYAVGPDGSFTEYVPLPLYSIRFGTSLQLDHHWEQHQAPRLSKFIRLALDLPSDASVSRRIEGASGSIPYPLEAENR